MYNIDYKIHLQYYKKYKTNNKSPIIMRISVKSLILFLNFLLGEKHTNSIVLNTTITKLTTATGNEKLEN